MAHGVELFTFGASQKTFSQTVCLGWMCSRTLAGVNVKCLPWCSENFGQTTTHFQPPNIPSSSRSAERYSTFCAGVSKEGWRVGWPMGSRGAHPISEDFLSSVSKEGWRGRVAHGVELG